jgi:D-alanyl-D-alanine carboxypeptidase/D-alanyl-D-alanine-endopeptidase (penicillin-binding protein 4)
MPGSPQLRLWGTLSGETQLLLAIDDPARYAAYAFRDALARRGVDVRGRPVALHRPAGAPPPPVGPRGLELAGRYSPPLVELLRILDKVSQNLHAELMLREVARAVRRDGARESGLEEERLFLSEAGIGKAEYTFIDGSGLSRMDLVTPAAVVKLLRSMYASRYRDAWMSLLPVGGEDGTLATRFDGHAAARRIHAKTGSLEHVAALSGYVDSASRGMLAFSILANNSNAPGSEIRALIDRIALLLAE